MNHTRPDSRYQLGIVFVFRLLLGLSVIATVILAWVPPVSRDALTHHLAVPKLYILHGGMVEIPHVPFSYYPMNLDLLYILPLYLGNDILPKFIHYAFALLTAGLIYAYLKKRLDTLAACAGALIFLTIPVILKLSITVYVDLGLVFFTTAALIYLFRWLEDGLRFRHLAVSAVFCGLGLGTKYNGLVTLFLLVLFVAYAFIHANTGQDGNRRQVKAVGYAVAYFIIAMLVFSPWMVRNALWTGNPVYPLYKSAFKSAPAKAIAAAGAESVAEKKKRTGSWNHLATRRIIYQESWAQIALIPLRIFFTGQDDNPKYFDGKLNPFLLLLSVFAFVYARRKESSFRFEIRLLLIFAILFVLIAILRTSIRIRYIAPVIPALTILSAFGLHNLIRYFNDREHRLTRQVGTAFTAAVVVLMLGMNTAYVVQQFKQVKPLDYISGKVTREAYILRHRPAYAVVDYANRHLPQDARIMGLFMGNRRYYCDRQLIFGESRLTKEVTRAQSTDSVGRSLNKQGYTHLILRFDLLKRWSGSLNDRERAILVDFLNRDLELIYRKSGYGLYRLTHLDA